jgi:hypothetical protein
MGHVAFEATHEWMVWVTVYYMYIVYSLLSLPFIALALPLISTILTQARSTLGLSRWFHILSREELLAHSRGA